MLVRADQRWNNYLIGHDNVGFRWSHLEFPTEDFSDVGQRRPTMEQLSNWSWQRRAPMITAGISNWRFFRCWSAQTNDGTTSGFDDHSWNYQLKIFPMLVSADQRWNNYLIGLDNVGFRWSQLELPTEDFSNVGPRWPTMEQPSSRSWQRRIPMITAGIFNWRIIWRIFKAEVFKILTRTLNCFFFIV